MRVAVVGCGPWGGNLVRNFQAIGCLGAVCDPSVEARARAARLAGPGVSVTDDLDHVIKSGIDGIAIATPSSTHFAVAKRALACGKHVFVEKPLALTVEEGVELVRLANTQQRILMVGHVLEYHPAIVTLKALLESGDLGTIQYLYSNRLSLGRVRREENTLWSFAPHDIAVILRLMKAMPYQVVACGGSYLQPNVQDVTVTNLLFNNGVRAHVFVSWLHPFKEQRLVIVGSSKMASLDDVGKRLVIFDQRAGVGEEKIPLSGQGGTDIRFPGDEPLRLECLAFLDAMRSGQPPLTDGYSGVRVLQVLDAAQRSIVMNGLPVTPTPVDIGAPSGGVAAL